MLPTLIKSVDAAKKAWRETSVYQHSFRERNPLREVGTYAAELKESYWVTSERGIYLLRDGRIFQVAETPCYGLAFGGDQIFLSAYYGHYTALLKGRRAALLEKDAPYEFEEIYGYKTSGSNERIHQLFCDSRHLWCASTGRNTLLQFDLSSGILAAEWPLFYDAFQKPILYDNHHINSVAAYGEVILFIAYRAGTGSLLGCLHEKQVIGFPYHHKGVHDFFLTGDNFLFCDTFGDGRPNTGGCAWDRHGPIDPDFFAKPPGCIVRGLAGNGEELIVGHSHKGERRKRFAGKGRILVIKNRKVVAELTLPCAQVYQLAMTSGTYLPAPSLTPNLARITSLLRQSLGEATYQGRSEPLLSPPQNRSA